MTIIQDNILVPVILSGGAGSRLWPVSRESHPKPFIKLRDGQSLLQKTYLRASQLREAAEIMTITNKEYYLKNKSEYGKLQVKNSLPTSYLLEPFARNTAAAILLAAHKVIAAYGPHAILLILPADHLIEDTVSFNKACEQAIFLSKMDKVVVFGVTPTSPETGFGYIECSENIAAHKHVYEAIRFVEKPNAELAETYYRSKHYFWNAGMFCFKAAVVIQAFKEYAPLLFDAADKCWKNSQQYAQSASVIEFDTDSFANLPDISIDYALMEKLPGLAVVPCHFDWQDIGSWDAYKKLHDTDAEGNTTFGETILIDSKNNLIHSESRMVASIGINNLAIVDTPDALLITSLERAQEVKQVVQTLKQHAHESYLTHRTVIRPWGSYTVLEEGPSFKIKRIIVHPEATLSLQLHQYRSEHWVVVEGLAKVVNGDQTYLLQKNESTFVPIGTPHRLSNPGHEDLIIIEVQTGTYVGEDDIVRLEDTYGRVKNTEFLK